jgi:hypothetical protein
VSYLWISSLLLRRAEREDRTHNLVGRQHPDDVTVIEARHAAEETKVEAGAELAQLTLDTQLAAMPTEAAEKETKVALDTAGS